MVGMTLVYSLMWPQDSEGGVARAPGGWWPPPFTGQEMLSGWSSPTFKLGGPFVDLQPNDAGIKLFSARMCRLIDEQKAATDRMEWLPVRVESTTDVRDYAMLHFFSAIDVIDRGRSVWNRVTGDVIKPRLRAEAIAEHQIFTYTNAGAGVVLLTAKVYEALGTCTGCAFARIVAHGPADA
jgi:hypothetical protein